MKNVNWNEIQDETTRPTPGGYVAIITKVVDKEEKEYLEVEWDFFQGPFKGANQATYDKFGFWPTPMRCSYKERALPFFKGFKTAVERSNQNYTFQNNPQSLVGKLVGLVLGEEEYIGNNGEYKTRLCVAEKRSVQSIREEDYHVPPKKKLRQKSPSVPNPPFPQNASDFSVLEVNDEELPF